MNKCLILILLLVNCFANGQSLDVNSDILFNDANDIKEFLDCSIVSKPCHLTILNSNQKISKSILLRAVDGEALVLDWQGNTLAPNIHHGKYLFYIRTIFPSDSLLLNIEVKKPISDLLLINPDNLEAFLLSIIVPFTYKKSLLTFGVLMLFAFLALFNGLSYLITKKIEFGYYTLYIVVIGAYLFLKVIIMPIACLSGECQIESLFLISRLIQPVFHILYVLFVREFFNSKVVYPLFDKVNLIYIWIAIFFLIILSIVYPISIELGERLFHIYRIIVITISLWSIVYIYRKHNVIHNYIVFGSAALVLFGLTSMVMSIFPTIILGFTPMDFMTLGVSIELLFFSLGIAHKSIIVSKQKAEYHEALNVALQENEQILKTNKINLETALSNVKTKLREEQKVNIANAINLKDKENEMSILHLQMNPHFLFNAMNSMKRYILKNDTKGAVLHLDRMSDLIRNLLSSSRKKTIKLSEELENTRLYLDIENERLKDKIDFIVEIAEGLDTNYYKIPPLLLQPFVENAIWHGLVHSTLSPKNISLTIEDKTSHLLIKIKDNGVGRLAAEQLQNSKNNLSIASSITRERIKLYNQGKDGLEVIDLLDKHGNPIGTEVMIKLWIK